MSSVKMIIICGLPGVGKSTISKPLAKRLNFTLFDIDDFIEPINETLISDSAVRGRIAYSILLNQVKVQASLNNSIIIDFPYTYEWLRKAISDIANDNGLKLIIIHCVCNEEIAIQRNLQRLKSDPRKYLGRDVINYLRIKENYLPIEEIVSMTINTGENSSTNVQNIIEYLEMN